MSVIEQRAALAKLANEARALFTDIETRVKQKQEVAQEERAKLEAMLAQGQELRRNLTLAEDIEDLHKFVNSPVTELRGTERNGAGREHKSWGDIVIESEQFKTNNHEKMDRVTVNRALPGTRPSDTRALYEGTDATGGVFVVTQRELEVLDIARQRPRRVLDLVNHSRTTVDAVEYVEMSTRTNAATPTAEYAGGVFGLKPESDLGFTLRTANVKTIPTWIAASRQLLEDAPRLRDMVDTELTYMVEVTLDQEILTGDGTGQHFTGVTAWSGIQTRVHRVSGRAFDPADSILDTLRKSITDVALEFYEATAIVAHPTQAEQMELVKDDTNNYVRIYDPVTLRVWRVPVVDTPAMTSGTAVTGNWMLGATLWDRMTTQIRVGEPNDYFLRNAVALLAELRAAFAVTRPLAFEKTTGL